MSSVSASGRCLAVEHIDFEIGGVEPGAMYVGMDPLQSVGDAPGRKAQGTTKLLRNSASGYCLGEY